MKLSKKSLIDLLANAAHQLQRAATEIQVEDKGRHEEQEHDTTYYLELDGVTTLIVQDSNYAGSTVTVRDVNGTPADEPEEFHVRWRRAIRELAGLVYESMSELAVELTAQNQEDDGNDWTGEEVQVEGLIENLEQSTTEDPENIYKDVIAELERIAKTKKGGN